MRLGLEHLEYDYEIRSETRTVRLWEGMETRYVRLELRLDLCETRTETRTEAKTMTSTLRREPWDKS